jgi:hypothetical protein
MGSFIQYQKFLPNIWYFRKGLGNHIYCLIQTNSRIFDKDKQMNQHVVDKYQNCCTTLTHKRKSTKFLEQSEIHLDGIVLRTMEIFSLTFRRIKISIIKQ